MNFSLSPSEESWLEEVRAFIAAEIGPEETEAVRRSGGEWGGDVNRAFRRRLVERGWIGLTWPEEYGGQGRTMVEQLLLMDELAYVGAPSIDMTACSVAPTIMRSGTEEQKQRWLPAILRGEVEFAIGYSEPDAGSDLTSLRTAAVADGDEWVIRGQKLWNTGAEYCTHEFLICRTDPDAPRRHQGLSVIILPIDSPGVTVREITTWRGLRTNEVFFDDVRVPATNVLGTPGDGWRYITQALDFERIAIGITGGIRRLVDELTGYCRTSGLLAHESVCLQLAELAEQLELARLLNYRAAWLVDRGRDASAPSSMTKVYTTELHARAATTAMEILGPKGQLDPDAAPLDGLAQLMYRAAPYLRFGGGTNEIQRDIIAQRGFGLPR